MLSDKNAKFIQYQKTKDIELRNELVEENLYIVEILIKKYLNKGVEYEDLYQVGAMALIGAVERFDPEKGYVFNSFATPTVLGEIKKYFRDKSWIIKVPRQLKELSVKLPGVKEKLTKEIGRIPTPSEIADEMGVSESLVVRAIETSMVYGSVSLDQTFEDIGEYGENNLLEKYTATEEKGYKDIEVYDIISDVMSKLTGTNRYIFKKRFIEEKSQSEIAEKLGVSQMSISRAERKIIEKFKLAKEI